MEEIMGTIVKTTEEVLNSYDVKYNYNGMLYDVHGDTETLKQIITELQDMDYICDNSMGIILEAMIERPDLKTGNDNPVMIFIYDNSTDEPKAYISFENGFDSERGYGS